MVGGDILGKDNEYIFKYRRVCHLHFESKYHTRNKTLSINAVPTLRLSSLFVKKRCHRNTTEQTLDVSLAAPSTSGLSSVGNRCLTDVTNQVLNMPPATPSTSGDQSQRQDERMDIDNDDLQKKTVHSVKSRIIKKCPGASEQQLHREIKKLQKDKDSSTTVKKSQKAQYKFCISKCFEEI
ncbi:uncharacterized protein LOC124641278 [Helicoverpa zea]|uniref:uncharacterized protein LOC124641278 n=1 Tax=Helicoverpa zea TaxID=7113 RepID=UPI001F5755C7|nr:uncharacterized protein LOC124641278 [Helicoverpa zea]